MTDQDAEANGSPSRERANLLADGSGSGGGLVEMFVPTSPGRGLHHDDDLDEDKHMLSDHFELEDGDSFYSDDGSDLSLEMDGGGDPHGMAVGSATPTQVAINIFISFVGAGLLGLPYAFSRSGWLLGSLSLCAVSSTNVYAMLLLVKCRKRLERQGITGIKGYGDVGREVMGPWGEVLVNVCLVISQAGFATAYLIFIGANIQKVTNGMASRALIIYACVPLLSLLVQFRNMKTLSPFSLIADVANVLGFSCVLFQDFEYYTHDDNIEAVDFRDREGFPRLLKQTITGITILMAVFGTCGYVAFGNQTISPISLNLKGESAAFVQRLKQTTKKILSQQNSSCHDRPSDCNDCLLTTEFWQVFGIGRRVNMYTTRIYLALLFPSPGTIEAIMKLLEDDDEVIEGNLEL
eukprot:scaffold12859_cov125-Skeletonema_dohrnii-CCMP3373.AAC.3